jgi:2-deoxy-D-gluconate 3-dehydrogenase
VGEIGGSSALSTQPPSEPTGQNAAALFDISGVRALVTGGTGAIGSAIARGFVAAGAHVAVVGRSENAGTIAAGIGDGVHGIAADLTDFSELSRAFNEATDALGGLDVLVTAHGSARVQPAAEYSKEFWDEMLASNLTSVFQLCQLAAPIMLGQGRGKIITVASMLSFSGGLMVAGYAASKGGVGQLTKGLANEWGGRGINVNAIAPGYIKTRLNEHIWRDPVRHDQILTRLPSGRWGTPQDLVGAAIFLASRASDYVHGILLPVDGGWLAR